MNISFIAENACHLSTSPIEWRGKLIFKAIEKNELHKATIISYEDFFKGGKNYLDTLVAKQLFILEASLRTEFIDIINLLKAKGKKVLIDIPVATDILELSNNQQVEPKLSPSLFISNHNLNNAQKLDEQTAFRWGLNLADGILVSSDFQLEKWKCCPPIKLIPEYIVQSPLENLIQQESEWINIGLFYCGNETDNHLLEIWDNIQKKFKNAKINIIQIPQLEKISEKIVQQLNNPQIFTNYEQIFSMDIGIFWDVLPVRGIFTRNVMEFLYKQKPIIINSAKGYHDTAKYGLIIEGCRDWQSDVFDIIHNFKNKSSITEKGYLYTISRSMDANINSVIHHFADILKTS